MVTGQAPVTLQLRNTPGKKHKQRWYTHISQMTQFMPPPGTYKSEMGSQPTICQVHAGAYVSLLAPGKTDYTACHPRESTTYILHEVPIAAHAHDRRKSIGKQKQRKEKERKERKGKTRKRGDAAWWLVVRCREDRREIGVINKTENRRQQQRHTE